MERYLIEHLTDLSDRAVNTYSYTYSDFLTPEEQAELQRNKNAFTHVAFFGGTPETERNVARFGDEKDLGYTEDFPIVCLRIAPKNAKFSEALSHRDYLGALMSLGIERSLLGDIVVREKEAYLFCLEKIAAYISEEVHEIRHTAVVVSRCEELPAGTLYETRELRLTVASLRLDCVTAAVVNRSRSAVADFLREKKVFLNSAVCENGAQTLSPGDRISVRGVGKFRFSEQLGSSKKGKLVIRIDKYV